MWRCCKTTIRGGGEEAGTNDAPSHTNTSWGSCRSSSGRLLLSASKWAFSDLTRRLKGLPKPADRENKEEREASDRRVVVWGCLSG